MADINFHRIDCMDFMREIPDKFYGLAMVDPPYFSGPEKRKYYGRSVSHIGVKRIDYPITETWEIPKADYFKEVFRISENQIIWGCNYFDYRFGSGRIVWDKVNGESSFSDCELAYCSFHDSSRIFRYMWNGMMQGKSIEEGHLQKGDKRLNEKKIHPTQKPVALYRFLLQTYAKKGIKILDTHGGSMSSAIACEIEGYDLDICEKDNTHFDNGVSRFNEFKAQKRMVFEQPKQVFQQQLFNL